MSNYIKFTQTGLGALALGKVQDPRRTHKTREPAPRGSKQKEKRIDEGLIALKDHLKSVWSTPCPE